MTILAHHVMGSGQPVLLLNGIMMSMGAWEPIARELAADYRVIRCDLRGQLLSPGAPPAAISGQAEEVIRLLDSLALERVHVAGTSFGALVGITVAGLYPSRVSSLVAMTTTDHADASMQPLFESLHAASLDAVAGGDKGVVFDIIVPFTFTPEWRSENAGAVRERRDAVGRLPDEWFSAYAGLLDSTRGVDLRPLLPHVACPTLIVGSGRDELFPVEHSRALAAAIPGARLEIVAGGSHGLVVEQPGLVASLVRGFVKENETR
jgi:pimeloyl-ACP methyl ester carboxylesterase